MSVTIGSDSSSSEDSEREPLPSFSSKHFFLYKNTIILKQETQLSQANRVLSTRSLKVNIIWQQWKSQITPLSISITGPRHSTFSSIVCVVVHGAEVIFCTVEIICNTMQKMTSKVHCHDYAGVDCKGLSVWFISNKQTNKHSTL